MVTDIQQARVADIQEKIAETHELLRLERDERNAERRHEYTRRIGQNLSDFQATLRHKFIMFLQSEFRMSLEKAQEYMRVAREAMIPTNVTPHEVTLECIRIDGGTQSREILNTEYIAELVETLTDGRTFKDAIVVYYDGLHYWLADGFHRYYAAKQAKITNIPIEVRQGTQEDAIEYSCGTNATHGLRRTKGDIKRAIERLIQLPRWKNRTQEEIARQCGATQQYVSKALREAGYNSCKNTVAQPVERKEDEERVRIRTSENDSGKRTKVETFIRENQAWDRSNREIAKECGVTEGLVRKVKSDDSTRTLYQMNTVTKASPDLVQKVDQGEMSLAKAYQQVKAEENTQEVQRLQEAVHPLTDQEIMRKNNIPIHPYDVWNFPTCDARFGRDYPGRIPGQLVANCLYFWTEQGDMVLDPMAGSGTTVDVCKVLNRRVLAYDAHPSRDDILLHNLATQGWPQETIEAKLIFWDPPYFKKKDVRYGIHSISRLERAEYLDFFQQMARTIPPDFRGRLAFLMSDYNDEKSNEQSIWFTDYVNIFTHHRWHVERYIQVPLTTQMIHPDIVRKFRESKRLARLGRGLVVMSR